MPVYKTGVDCSFPKYKNGNDRQPEPVDPIRNDKYKEGNQIQVDQDHWIRGSGDQVIDVKGREEFTVFIKWVI